MALCINEVPNKLSFLRKEWLYSVIDMPTQAMDRNSIAHRLIRDGADLTVRETNLFRKSFVDISVMSHLSYQVQEFRGHGFLDSVSLEFHSTSAVDGRKRMG